MSEYTAASLMAEVMELRDRMVPILNKGTQGAAVGACCQVIYEQLHDTEIPVQNLLFMQQQLETLQSIITSKLCEAGVPTSTVRH
jgi:hypothetical protein